jgi:hypothetical protein
MRVSIHMNEWTLLPGYEWFNFDLQCTECNSSYTVYYIYYTFLFELVRRLNREQSWYCDIEQWNRQFYLTGWHTIFFHLKISIFHGCLCNKLTYPFSCFQILFLIYLAFQSSTFSVSEESYFRNAPCALNLIALWCDFWIC